MIYLLVALWFGIATGIIGRLRGSSFFIWFIVGAVAPVIGVFVALLYRSERDEVRRECPGCGAYPQPSQPLTALGVTT